MRIDRPRLRNSVAEASEPRVKGLHRAAEGAAREPPVRLLADVAAWSISAKQAVDAIVQTFGADVLPMPKTTR